MAEAVDPDILALDDEHFHMLAVGTLQMEFDAGNLLAADQAIEICLATGRVVPNWAVEEWKRRLDSLKAFSAGLTGRHAGVAYPVAQARDRMNRLNVYAAVEAIKKSRPNLKGRARYEFAATLLHRLKGSLTTASPDSLKSIYHSVRRTENPGNHFLIWLYQKAISEGE